MEIKQYTHEIANELQRSTSLIADEEAEQLVTRLLTSKRIFIAGAGRSGLMGRAFAMRLMHSGLDAYVVGETVTPGITQEDILIIGSGSGETKSLVAMAQKAKSLGAAVALVTIAPQSAIRSLADLTVTLPGVPKDQAAVGRTSIQPMASLFEQTMLLFYDAAVLRLMEKMGLDSSVMYARHANLE